MSQRIYSDLSGNAFDARVRMAPQPYIDTLPGGGAMVPVIDASLFLQGQVYGGGPVITRNEIPDQVLAPAGKPLDGLEGKFVISGGPLAFGTMDARNPLQLMAYANAFGRYSYSSPFGTGTGYLVNNVGGYAAGTTVIAVNTGTGTVLAGDWVTFAGDSNPYRVASSVGGSTVTSVTIEAPGLAQAVADDAAMTVASYRVWRFGLSESTRAVPWLSAQWNNQVTQIANFAGLLFHGFNVTVAANQALALAMPYGIHAFSEFGDVTQTAGTGSTKPRIIGTFDDQWAESSVDAHLYVKVTDAALKTLKAKLADATSYGGASTSTTYVLGSLIRLVRETGARIGAPHEQAMLYWPTGATLTTDDVFKILRRREPWSESLPSRSPISSVNMSFLIDGEQIAITGGANSTNGWSNVYSAIDPPGAQGAIIENSGAFESTITPTRRITEISLQKKLRTAGFVSVVLDSISSVTIGNTRRNYRVIHAYPRCKVNGSLFATDAGGANKDESPALTAKDPTTDLVYPDGYGGNITFSDPCTVYVETSVAEITGLAAA